MAIDIKLTTAGIRDAMKTPEVRRALLDIATLVADNADATSGALDGHQILPPEIGQRRMRVAVITRSAAAIRGEAQRRTLTRALLAGRTGR